MLQVAHELELLINCEARDDRLQHRADRDMVCADERRVIHVCEHAHQKPLSPISHSDASEMMRYRDALAIHTIRHTAVAGDRVSEVLDVECALEARSEEAAEGRDERGEASKDNKVDLEGRVGDRIPGAR